MNTKLIEAKPVNYSSTGATAKYLGIPSGKSYVAAELSANVP